MPIARLEAVRETLDHELELAEAEVGRLKAELEAAQKERRAIHGALVALGRKKPSKPTGKPAPKKDQVIQIVEDLLKANGPMPREDLEALAKENLTEAGVGLNGFGLRFGEAMKDDRFAHESNGTIRQREAASVSR